MHATVIATLLLCCGGLRKPVLQCVGPLTLQFLLQFLLSPERLSAKWRCLSLWLFLDSYLALQNFNENIPIFVWPNWNLGSRLRKLDKIAPRYCFSFGTATTAPNIKPVWYCHVMACFSPAKMPRARYVFCWGGLNHNATVAKNCIVCMGPLRPRHTQRVIARENAS